MSATRPWTSGSFGSELGEDAPEAERVLAEARPHPVVAGGRGVALVEHEIDHFEHRGEPFASLRPVRNLEGHVGLRERALGADDALRDGRLADEERAGDLVGGQTAEETQREGDARLGGQHWVTGDEHEAQQVVADVVVELGVEIDLGVLGQVSC